MESRKTVLINLFAGKGWRHKCREGTWHSEGRRGWDDWESSIDKHIPSCIK